MRILAIGLKSNHLFPILVTSLDEAMQWVPIEPLRLTLEDDEKQQDIKAFVSHLSGIMSEYAPDAIFIKKRMKKGRMAGGAISFKLEGLIQFSATCPVELVAAQSVAAHVKKSAIVRPKGMHAYQEDAFFTACYGMSLYI